MDCTHLLAWSTDSFLLAQSFPGLQKKSRRIVDCTRLLAWSTDSFLLAQSSPGLQKKSRRIVDCTRLLTWSTDSFLLAQSSPGLQKKSRRIVDCTNLLSWSTDSFLLAQSSPGLQKKSRRIVDCTRLLGQPINSCCAECNIFHSFVGCLSNERPTNGESNTKAAEVLECKQVVQDTWIRLRCRAVVRKVHHPGLGRAAISVRMWSLNTCIASAPCVNL